MFRGTTGTVWSSKGLVSILLFVGSLVLYLPRIQRPEGYVFDEVYHAYTAGEYVKGNAEAYRWDTNSSRRGVAYMWNHPPVGLWTIASGIAVWGNDSFGWRFASAVFGAAGIVLLFLLTCDVTGSVLAAMTAGCLLMMNSLYMVQSRIGMLDIFGAVFMLCALWAFYRYLKASSEFLARPMLAIGLFLGLAIATKWNAGFPALMIGLVILGLGVASWVRFRKSADREDWLRFLQHAKWMPIALIAVPVAVYLLAYVPFFLVGNGLDDFVELQKQIFMYHTGLEESHPYQSLWWQWPLALKPVWYSVTYGENSISNIYAGSNPLLAWLFLPSVCFAAWVLRNDKPAMSLLLVGFFGQWLPWFGVSRISFTYHFLPASIFGCLAVAVSLVVLAQKGRLGGVVAVAVMLAIMSSFFFFYPIHANFPLSRAALDARMLFDSWR